MIQSRGLGLAPEHARFALGYACTCIWAVVLLSSSAFNGPNPPYTVAASMIPGLVACLSSILLFKKFPRISGRTPLVMTAGTLVAGGTFACTYPTIAHITVFHAGGLILSGFLAIIVIMAWFDAFARLSPRAIIVLAGCSVSIAGFACWGILSCSQNIASILTSCLPLISVALLPSKADYPAYKDNAARTLREVVAAAIPLRTLLGLAITFFIVRSIAALAPSFDTFSAAVSPLSLLIPICVTAFFIGSALLVRNHIDPSILYKIILAGFAGVVFLLASSVGVTSSLVFYATIVSEVATWTMLSLWAKKTPVQPHIVFAFGWIAECAGNALGQATAPQLISHENLFFAVAIVLIVLAVGFAFSEGQLVLDMDLDENDAPALLDRTKSMATLPQNDALASQGDPDNAEPDQEEADPLEAFNETYGISPRESDVLALWLAGRGMRYIENELFISESTVKSHLRSIYRKCGTHNRDETISLFEKETKR